MANIQPVITGVGVIAPNGIGRDEFWQALEQGKNSIAAAESFDTSKFSTNLAGEAKNFDAKKILEPKGLRNLDRSALFLLAASQMALDEAKITIDDSNTDDFGVCTGTTFSHLWSISEFDKEVFTEGLNFANPALFPSTVVNAASSHVSIRFNIQGFNATITTGYTSYLESLKYTVNALRTDKAKVILSAGVDVLTSSLFFGFYKLGYMAGIKGPAISCPFDKRRNGPVPAEGAAVFTIEDINSAKKRKTDIYAKIRGVATYFDATSMGKINPEGDGLVKSINMALNEAGVKPEDIDYISSCANSSVDLDKTEVVALKKVFGSKLKNIAVSSIKSMIGETFSASGALQIASCIGAMKRGIIPPTINFSEADADCDIDCVANKSRKKDIKLALVTSFGPGGYNSACVLENYAG